MSNEHTFFFLASRRCMYLSEILSPAIEDLQAYIIY